MRPAVGRHRRALAFSTHGRPEGGVDLRPPRRSRPASKWGRPPASQGSLSGRSLGGVRRACASRADRARGSTHILSGHRLRGRRRGFHPRPTQARMMRQKRNLGSRQTPDVHSPALMRRLNPGWLSGPEQRSTIRDTFVRRDPAREQLVGTAPTSQQCGGPGDHGLVVRLRTRLTLRLFKSSSWRSAISKRRRLSGPTCQVTSRHISQRSKASCSNCSRRASALTDAGSSFASAIFGGFACQAVR